MIYIFSCVSITSANTRVADVVMRLVFVYRYFESVINMYTQ